MKFSDTFSRTTTGSYLGIAGRWIKQRRILVGAIVVVAVGLAMGWQWLAAIGALPILLSTLPCAFMMGMCMKGMKSSGGGDADAKDTTDTGSGEPSPGSLQASSPDASPTTPKKETLHA